MKKIALMVLFFVLTLSFQPNTFVNGSQTAYDSSTITYQDNFLSYYYANLHENYGRNLYGSCGFIAIQMYLQYFDIIYSPVIIDGGNHQIRYDFEVSSDVDLAHPYTIEQSPGTYREPFDENDFIYFRDENIDHQYEKDLEYFNYVEENYTDYFQFFLIHLASVFPKPFNSNEKIISLEYNEATANRCHYEMVGSDIKKLMECYFFDYTSLHVGNEDNSHFNIIFIHHILAFNIKKHVLLV